MTQNPTTPDTIRTLLDPDQQRPDWFERLTRRDALAADGSDA